MLVARRAVGPSSCGPSELVGRVKVVCSFRWTLEHQKGRLRRRGMVLVIFEDVARGLSAIEGFWKFDRHIEGWAREAVGDKAESQ